MPSTGATGAVGAPYDPSDNPFKGQSQPPPSPAENVQKSRLPVERRNG
jgi:hypothetical protein